MRRIALLPLAAVLSLLAGAQAFGASPVVTDVSIDRGRDAEAPDWASYHQYFTVAVSDADGAGDIVSVTITDADGAPHTITPSEGGVWAYVDITTIRCSWFDEDLTAPPPPGAYAIVAADAASNEGSLTTPPALAIPEHPLPLAPAPDSVITDTTPTFQWNEGPGGFNHVISVREEGDVWAIWTADAVGATEVEYNFDDSAWQSELQLNHTYVWALDSRRADDYRVTDPRVEIWTTHFTRSRFAVYGPWEDIPPDLPGQIAYMTCLWAEDGYTWAYSTTSILAYDADAHTRQWLGPIGADYPDWSPDGSKLLYAKGPGLWVDSLDETAPAQIPGVAGGDCRWASDSLRVVYATAGPPSPHTPSAPWNYDVWVSNIDGTDSYAIADSIYHDERWPAWSPDGLWIAYRKLPTTEGSSLWLVRYDRTEDHPLIATGVEGYPDYGVIYMGEHAWSPDGNRLAVNFSAAYDTDEISGIGIISRDGGPITPVFISPAEAICCTGAHLPEWSPDGSQVVFTSAHHLQFHTGPGDWSSDGELYLANADGSGEPTRLTYDHSFSYYVSWWAPNTEPGEDVSITTGDTTVTFDEVSAIGNTSVTVYEEPIELPTNFAFCQEQYQITTTAEIAGPITICMRYDDADIPTGSSEEDLCLLHYVADGDYWEDITVSRDPDNNVVCGECSFLSVLTLALAPSARFPDVPSHGLGEYGIDPHWAFYEVEACAEGGIVAGYPDGTYQPANVVTRDQMAAYISRALAGGDDSVPEFTGTPSFPDVDADNWALDYVEYAFEQNVVAGYQDGTYHPEYEVTRAQMAVYVARALVAPTGEAALADYVPADPRDFPDVPPTGYGDDGTDPYWAYTHIEYCVEHGVVQGYPDGSYYPENIVTRDQMAVYVARAFRLLAGWRVVGYLPDYRLSTLASMDLGSVTNLIYFALHADPSGDLQVGATYLNGLPDVVSAAHAAGATVSACVGGWQSDSYFSPLSRSPSARAEFISQLVSFCLDHGLDGVDLNWEPVADADVPYYSLLIEELRAALAPHGLLLSAAVSSSHHDILDSTVRHLSWVGVMAYDMNWPHADHASYGDALAALTFWTDYGIDRAKLLIGIPFYARNEGWTSVLTYAQIVDQYTPTPDQNWADGYFFNGIQLVQDKTSYALANGFGGMMIWELGQDKFDSRSLLAAIAATANEHNP